VTRRRREPREAKLRRRVEQRAGGRCEYCRAPQHACGYRFHLEHIRPKALGGSDAFPNRALACASCNLAKADRVTGGDPVTDTEVPLFHPRTMAWADHFAWENDCQTVAGLTPTGRATVAALDLNSDLRRQARRLWVEAGLLPEARESS
jgi:HNH endonuclease